MYRLFLFLLAVTGMLLLSGCASRLPLSGLDATAVELAEVPFHPQQDYQCGPAALATVLQWTEVDVTPAQLAPALMLPARQGSLQIELQAQARVQGRVPFRVQGDLAILQAELAAGQPLLVLLNLAFDWRPLWHYAVVVGIDPAARTLTLRSGRERRQVIGFEAFDNTWARSGRWALLVLPPGALPARADSAQVLEAIAPFEEQQRWDVAAAVYRSAHARWPQQTVFGVGLAYALYAQGELAAAEAVYRQLLVDAPDDPVSYNNLALLLAEQRRWEEAERLIQQALAIGGPLRAEFEDTQRQIQCRRAGQQACP